MDGRATLAIPEIWPMRLHPERTIFASGDDAAVHNQVVLHFDQAANYFERGRWLDGTQLLHHTTAAARRALSDLFWITFARNGCVAHPIRKFMHQDPFTRRSFERVWPEGNV